MVSGQLIQAKIIRLFVFIIKDYQMIEVLADFSWHETLVMNIRLPLLFFFKLIQQILIH